MNPGEFDPLTRPWLEHAGGEVFADRVLEERRRLSSAVGAVVIAEREPFSFLAAFVAALLEGRTTVLANPDWQQLEWEAVGGFLDSRTTLRGQSRGVVRFTGPALSPEHEGEIWIPTGGSSGGVRFARHRVETLVAAAEGFLRFWGGRPINSYCLLPLFHVSGLMQVFRALVSGGRVHLARAVGEPLSPPGEEAEWFLSLVPTQLQRWLAAEGAGDAGKRFRAILVGGAAASADLLERAAERKWPIALTYGMTETAAMVAALRPEAFWSGRRDCGEALPHVRLRVVEGRIAVAGASLFCGYAGEPDRTEDWWKTGDLGELSAEGGLRVRGRGGRWIASGGEKILLPEIEELARTLPGVAEALAVGVEDVEWGQALVLFWVRSPEAAEADLRARLRAKVAPHKVPKVIIELPALPRTVTGKIDRGALAELAGGRRLVEER